MSTNASTQGTASETATEVIVLRSGYDVPPYGLDNGNFYYLHISAIVCIMCSLVCAVISIILSFRRQTFSKFFTKWTKSERFIIYMAVCDGLFNASHSLDHFHMVITHDHVYPKELCVFYGFSITLFITAQMLLVNVVAINIFMLMFFNINLNFGRRDWRLLTYTFGVPFLISLIAAVTGQYGPAGISCYFDTVNGQIAVWLTSVPSVLIIVTNIVLYILTWRRINTQTASIKQVITNSATGGASYRTARNMSLFVAVFIVQWWSVAVYCVWLRIDKDVHPVVIYFVVTLSNLGGCLNLAVCLLIRRKRPNKDFSRTVTLSRESVLDKTINIHKPVSHETINRIH